MEEINVKLDIFEGPLDLLLHLIKTLEIDIYDIPIAEITEQYMNYIHTMRTLDLEIAGEFLVMAATLMAIKSKMLLPQEVVEVDDESEYDALDPREVLVQQLLDYKKFKYVATVLKEMETERGDYFTKEATDLSDYEKECAPLEPNEVTMIDLYLAIHDVMTRAKEMEPMETSIVMEDYTIDDRIEFVMSRVRTLSKTEYVLFDELFTVYTRSEIVMTFLAMLELIKKRDIVVKQSSVDATIQIFNKEGQ
ncbi:segregation/condensation protein A [Vagococcus teuberi]|uniref:Segregation and condensation protein A n=1 Tax=Vagococcus teuberi TaxID=519472 RepID=A0A1J0A6A3_9ENTE|nr:segregation/condensation protein A [Vagococcus teuberi]APB31462.1 segregation/condensation protein A [Vagococcus teuberi]